MGGNKHEIYTAMFDGYKFCEYLYSAGGMYPLPSPGSDTGNDMNYICNEQDSDLT